MDAVPDKSIIFQEDRLESGVLTSYLLHLESLDECFDVRQGEGEG